MSTMEANEDKIDGTLQSGQRLVDSNNLYSGKIQDKMDSIKDRWVFSGPLRQPTGWQAALCILYIFILDNIFF